MKQLKKIILPAAAIISSLAIQAQDLHFSQIFETPLLRNPSLAGIFTGDVRLQSVYRNQWNSVTVPYQTTSLSGEYRKQVGNGDDFITIGGQILYDKAGTVALTTTQVLPAINYNKSLSQVKNMYLSLGFMGGLVQRRFDRSKMTTNNQFDGTGYNGSLSDGENLTAPSYSYLDGSVGMSLNSQIGENDNNNYFIGLAYHHFNQARKVSFYGDTKETLTPKWVASGGVRVSMTSKSFFTLQADYSQQGSSQEIVGGALYSIKLSEAEDNRYLIHTGAYMRWKDAIIPVAKLEFKPMAVAISYDANISQLKSSSNGQGGFEVSLTYQKHKKENSSLDAIRCPKF